MELSGKHTQAKRPHFFRRLKDRATRGHEMHVLKQNYCALVMDGGTPTMRRFSYNEFFRFALFVSR